MHVLMSWSMIQTYAENANYSFALVGVRPASYVSLFFPSQVIYMFTSQIHTEKLMQTCLNLVTLSYTVKFTKDILLNFTNQEITLPTR